MLSVIWIFGYLFWNVYCFLLMYADKQKAIVGAYRVPERRLILNAFLFGAFGIAFGMMTFSHKVKKIDFIFKVILAILFNIFGLCLLLIML